MRGCQILRTLQGENDDAMPLMIESPCERAMVEVLVPEAQM